MNYEILDKNIKGCASARWLIKLEKEVKIEDEDIKTQYFVASGVDAYSSGWEVLVFPSDQDGMILDWGEVAGGRDMSHQDAVDDLINTYK